MDFRIHIPNTFTILNLLAGSLSLLLLFKGAYTEAAVLILIASVFDFLDGFSAKMLNAKSLIGKELDSLADVVSFGLVPAVFLYVLMSRHPLTSEDPYSIFPYFALLIGAFSALRLAKFNLDTRQSVSFIGLPTPANAILIIALAMIPLSGENIIPAVTSVASNLWFQLALIPISSYLLVSDLPMFSLKFSRGYKFTNNKLKYTFIVFIIVATALFHWTGIAISMVVYVLTCLFSRKQ
ncbi:MAG TPA: CDP-diacylglycerol--serine O-phosphatidyltransferase [Lentimicrobium sp.]|nr:CDP-diacylglycerol--serine O-phosphatidyltransferase [Lentimicrobium sp.]